MTFIYKFTSVYYALNRVTYKVQLCITAICCLLLLSLSLALHNSIKQRCHPGCLPACTDLPPPPLKGNVNICVFVCRILIAAVFGTRNK